MVDSFGVKYVGEKYALHLKQTLEENFKFTTERDGTRYIGITLDCDYRRIQVHLSLPGYTDKALTQFNHTKNKKQNQPYASAPIIYGTKKQYATQPSAAPLLDKKGKKFIQQVCGKVLFLGRSVNITLLFPISAITSQYATPNKETMRQTNPVLDYIATQEEAVTDIDK